MCIRDRQRDVDTYEAQPTDEMEVITVNNVETSTDETPHVEPEIEVTVDNQPRRPEAVSYTHLDVYKRQT